MKYKKLTPAEYAALRGITSQAVIKAIDKKHNLPGVTKTEKFGRFFVITVKVKEDGTLEY